jgi:hypothetical protein
MKRLSRRVRPDLDPLPTGELNFSRVALIADEDVRAPSDKEIASGSSALLPSLS